MHTYDTQFNDSWDCAASGRGEFPQMMKSVSVSLSALLEKEAWYCTLYTIT